MADDTELRERESIAEEGRYAALSSRLERAEALAAELEGRVETLLTDLARAEARAEEAEKNAASANDAVEAIEGRVSDLEDSASGQIGDTPHSMSREEVEQIARESQSPEPLFPFKVIVMPAGDGSNQQDVWVLVPRDDIETGGDSTKLRDRFGPIGGVQIGSTSTPRGGKNRMPWPLDGGGLPTGDRPDYSWAHFSWYKAGTLNGPSVVVVRFAAGSISQVEGEIVTKPPSIGSGTTDLPNNPGLKTIEEWDQMCEDSWKSGTNLYYPVAYVANSHVMQLMFGMPTVGWVRGGAYGYNHAASMAVGNQTTGYVIMDTLATT